MFPGEAYRQLVGPVGLQHHSVGQGPGPGDGVDVIAAPAQRQPRQAQTRQLPHRLDVTLRCHLKMGQGIAVIAVDAQLGHQHVWGKGPNQRRHHLTKSGHIVVIRGVRVKRQVDRVTPAWPFSQLSHGARARKQVLARLVD